MADVKLDPLVVTNHKIILYDLPTQDPPTAWSLNTWKTRLALNFKGIDYKTQWIEYPDIASVLKSLNTTPNTNTKLPPYTVPTVQFPSGETVLDSLVIAAKIEELFPTPPMRLDAPIIPDIQMAVGRAFSCLFSIITPINILNESSAIYFAIKDAKDVANCGPDPVGEAAWEAAMEPLKNLAKLIKGPFVLGEEVSYADFVIVGFLRHAWRVGGVEVCQRVLHTDESGKLRGVYEGVERKGLLERSN